MAIIDFTLKKKYQLLSCITTVSIKIQTNVHIIPNNSDDSRDTCMSVMQKIIIPNESLNSKAVTSAWSHIGTCGFVVSMVYRFSANKINP